LSTRAEIRERFRAENPEIDVRVIPDATLNSWMKTANKEVCAETRCIVSNVASTFNTTIGLQYYDIQSLISNFFDVDELPGGGIYYNDVPLEKKSPSEMNGLRRSWRSGDSGTPKYWWLRGRYLWFDRAPDAAQDVDIDSILIPDDFDSDSKSPFNEQTHLQIYDDSINKYLQWRTKAKVGKVDESAIAKADYMSYIKWMKSSVGKMRASVIQMRPRSYPTNE